MGKGGGGSSSGYGGESGATFTPAQMGSATSAAGFRPKWWDSALNGIFKMMKGQVQTAFKEFGTGTEAADVKAYGDRVAQIADTMMVSFAQNVKPDELKTFPLDDFIQTSIKSVYDKAGDIYAKPTLDRAEIKTMIDANTENMAVQFRQRRRGIEQEIQARGLSGPAAAEARDRAELDVSRAKEGVARETLANEFGQKYNRQLQALQVQQGATGQAESYVGQQSQRWLNQWGQKLTAEGLRQQGLQLQLGATQQAYGNKWNQMNYPAQMLTQYVNPWMAETGRQALAEFGTNVEAYRGAGVSSKWSSEEALTPGNYHMPGFSWST